MAYQTGTVVGGSALLAALVTFMTTNCGAIVLDTLSANDKVLTWTGSDGRKKYLRLTTTGDVGNPVKYGKERWRDGIISRLYVNWDSVAHTGTMRAGRWGPFLAAHTSTANQPLNLGRLPDNDTYPILTTGTAPCLTLPTKLGGLIGNRLVYNINNTLISFTDLTTGESWNSSASPDGGSINNNQATYAVSSDGREHIYVLGAIGTHFWRYDIDTDAWNQLTDPPWAAASSAGFCLYDGNDTIYAARGSNTTSFAKYTISTNTWTTLTALPAARGTTWNNYTVAAYVPAAASGLANDQILFAAAANSTTIYRYDVGAATFTAITLPVNIGTAAGYIGSFAFDDSKFIHFITQNSVNAYILDVTTLAAPVFPSNPYTISAIANAQGCEIFRQTTGIVFCDSSSNTTYYFVGDTDSLAIATIENNRCWVAAAGIYDSYRGNNVTTTTAALVAGFQTSIPVASSTGYTQGDVLDLVNSDGTNWELITVTSVPDGTHIVANVTKTHTSGAFVGRDVLAFVVAGSSGLASTPRDGQGYQTDYSSASWHVRPACMQQALNNTAPGGDKYFQNVPLQISGPPCSGPNSNTTIGAGSMNANLGTLRNLFAFGIWGATPPAAGQQVIGTDGKTYVALRPNSEYRFASGSVAPHGFLLGPIN